MAPRSFVVLVALFLVAMLRAAEARFVFALFGTGLALHKISLDDVDTITRTISLTGLATGEVMLGIDFVPGGGQVADVAIPAGLYGVSSAAKIYIINTRTGAVGTGRQISAASGCPASFDPSEGLAFDNNPTNAGLRITTASGANYAVSGYAVTGACATQTAYANPTTAAAYLNPVFGATGTTLYVYNRQTSTFGTVTPASNGAAFAPLPNSVGLTVTSNYVAADIVLDDQTNRLFAVFTTAEGTSLYTVDTTSGSATRVDTFGNSAPIRAIAISLSDNSDERPVWALSGADLVQFFAEDPSSISFSVPLTGQQNGDVVIGLSFQPLSPSFTLYAIGRASDGSGRLYTVNSLTGALTLSNAISCNLAGDSFVVDFNPINNAGAIRVISNTNNNYRITAATGVCATDVAISGGGPLQAIAYTNSVSGATTTELLAIDGSSDPANLGRVNPPNDGVYAQRASLTNRYPNTAPLNAVGRGAFDIAFETAYAALGAAGNGLFGRLDVSNGNFYPIMIGSRAINGLAIPFVFNPLPPLPVNYNVIVQVGNTMFSGNTGAAGTTATRTVTGLGTATLLAISLRPANQQIYAVSTDSIYTINLNTNNNELAATRIVGLTGCTLIASSVADFNPVADRLRVLDSARNNYRINVETGECLVDTPITYSNSSVVASPAGVAYTNSVAGTTATAEYMLDEENDVFAQVANPNGGLSVALAAVDVEDLAPIDFVPSAGAQNGFFLSGSVLNRINLNGDVQQLFDLGFTGDASGLVVLPDGYVPPQPITTSSGATATTTTGPTTGGSGPTTTATTSTTATATVTGTATTSAASSAGVSAVAVLFAIITAVIMM